MPAAKKSKPPERTEPVPILLTRKQWLHVQFSMKALATPQQNAHIAAGLEQKGDPLIITISPTGAKWLACEVFRGNELGEEIYRQWHFFCVCDMRPEPKGQYVFFDAYDKVP